MLIKPMLEEVVKRKASDLHLKLGTPPTVRVDGELVPLDVPQPTLEDMATALPLYHRALKRESGTILAL